MKNWTNNINTNLFNSDNTSEEEFLLRQRIFSIISVEYGRVIQRELKKNPNTLSAIMSEGITYKEFLENQLDYVQNQIGFFEEGKSFFEEMYLEHFDDGQFDSITAKNLILTYRYRLDSFKNSENLELDEHLKDSIKKFVDKLVGTTDDIASFNLQEKSHRIKLIEAISQNTDFEFQKKAISLIEKQSLLVLNLMNEVFINRLSNSLEQEKKLKIELIQKQKMMNNDLKKARKIQENLLPKSFPSNVGIKFYAKYSPMEDVGGDFYDVQVFQKTKETEQDKIGILIADVSGHGIAAAFIAAMAKIIWENTFKLFRNPSDILKRLNLQMVEISAGNFLTAFLGIFENYHSVSKINSVAKGIFRYASGGHFSPYILRNNLDSITLKIKGQLIGVFQNINIDEYDVEYYSGDRFIFYTDGLLEAKNNRNEMLGEVNLFKIFDSIKNIEGNLAADKILNEINLFTNNRKIDDDITLLIVDIE